MDFQKYLHGRGAHTDTNRRHRFNTKQSDEPVVPTTAKHSTIVFWRIVKELKNCASILVQASHQRHVKHRIGHTFLSQQIHDGAYLLDAWAIAQLRRQIINAFHADHLS